jgi:hypothetical protein
MWGRTEPMWILLVNIVYSLYFDFNNEIYKFPHLGFFMAVEMLQS